MARNSFNNVRFDVGENTFPAVTLQTIDNRAITGVEVERANMPAGATIEFIIDIQVSGVWREWGRVTTEGGDTLDRQGNVVPFTTLYLNREVPEGTTHMRGRCITPQAFTADVVLADSR